MTSATPNALKQYNFNKEHVLTQGERLYLFTPLIKGGWDYRYATPSIPVPQALHCKTNTSNVHDILSQPFIVDSDFSRPRSSEALFKSYKFVSFLDAFAYMTQVALWAEKLDHHPEWHNVFDRVSVLWRTRQEDGLTEADAAMAALCDELYIKFTK